jgi:hypothetical protein
VDPVLVDDASAAPPGFAWQPRPKFKDRVWLHALLLLLTIATTTIAGANHYAAFIADFGPGDPSLSA